ncbi:MAG TPA: SRPBCC domain-containing protein [Polyangia bacterium]|nr:SRPBCC domain-containing protein [Polyangia bacterium]
MTDTTRSQGSRRRIALERTFDAPVEDVWELWTTKAGVESWWGPEGFQVEVHAIDARPGGEVRYAMRATGAAQIEAMRRAGMPLVTEARFTYRELVRHRRLTTFHAVDFVPGVAAYEVETAVELHPGPSGVRMVVTIDAMHDAHWTEMARRGWESQLDKAMRLLSARRG